MAIPMLNQCCCGCTLKVGTCLIGVLSFIYGIFSAVTGIIQITSQEKHLSKAASDTLGVTEVTMGTLLILIALLLEFGAEMGIPNLLLPYMVFCILSIFTQIITASIEAVKTHKQGEIVEGIIIIVVGLTYIGLQLYFFLVVYSLYRQQKEDLDMIRD